MNKKEGSIELNTLIILIVFIALCKIHREHKVKLESMQNKLLADLKNKHMIPEQEIARAFFDNKEILWILVKDKAGKEILKRADGKPNNTIDDDYEYQYIRDATRYPI